MVVQLGPRGIPLARLRQGILRMYGLLQSGGDILEVRNDWMERTFPWSVPLQSPAASGKRTARH
ncbi:MAG: hypothetical protein FWD79_06500 [Desulfobulbus sp.]|nr:hypothetical protein [Desulfobulbus sp.]